MGDIHDSSIIKADQPFFFGGRKGGARGAHTY